MTVSVATCRLCIPPEVIGADLIDHVRLFHPDHYDFIAGALRGSLDGAVEPDPAPDAPFEYPVMTADELEPHGIVCADCGREFRPGDRYASQLMGMLSGLPVTQDVCVPCGEAS